MRLHGLAVSLLAFKAVHERVPSAFLFLRALPPEAFGEAGRRENGLPLDVLIAAVGLVEGSYAKHDQWLTRLEVFELYQLADVLLQPSKTEGFALPVLEAQLVGTPVVSTRFGALGDYTRYGIAVPPIDQPYFLSRGFAALAARKSFIFFLESLHSVHPD